MRVLVTGAAGFIGNALAVALAGRGHGVIGVDNFNLYYDPELKAARARRLEGLADMVRLDVADHAAFRDLVRQAAPDVVVHLAAQAGVRYSLEGQV